jgi:cytochrome bd ubiquinol oxidase subunit I
MAIDSTFISRVQFAFTISFHILFPAFSIGLATFLAIMEGVWLWTKKPIYLSICKFWIKIFALTFGMGVVSGVVMEFQLGTNWSGFTREVGPVLGSLFTYEVLTAFFIEAGFLGVMIFGWDRVGKKLHYFATLLVFFGVTLSAFWILSANSWMQTPAGAIIINHQFVVKSWYHVIFNHSTVVRYFHMLFASYLSTALVIAGISAYYLIRKKHFEFAKKCFSFSMIVVVILIPLQIFVGDEAGLKVHEYQPIKTAAIEGAWNTEKGAPLLLLAWPNQAKQKNDFAIGIPHLASLINTHRWNGELQGLKSVPRADQPFVWLTFYSFRIMVAAGFLMLLLGLLGLCLRFRQHLYDRQWFLRLCTWSSPIGFLALIAGWFTAETGRQPWVVYNLLKTSDAASVVGVDKVIISFALLFIVYGIIFGVFYFRYFGKVLKQGPMSIEEVNKLPFAYMQPINKKGER